MNGVLQSSNQAEQHVQSQTEGGATHALLSHVFANRFVPFCCLLHESGKQVQKISQELKPCSGRHLAAVLLMVVQILFWQPTLPEPTLCDPSQHLKGFELKQETDWQKGPYRRKS